MGEADYGLHVWPCAQVLGSFIRKNRELLEGKKILEIGCGTGFVGIAASKLCNPSHLILSDRSCDQRILDLARKNCQMNGLPDGSYDVIGLTWGSFEPILDRLTGIDIILASDCFYDPSVFEDVMITVYSLLKRNPTGSVYFSYQNRCSSWSIECLLEKYGLICKRLSDYCNDYPSVHIGIITLDNGNTAV